MNLFCIKPFHSDDSPRAADKYKFLRLDSCTHECFQTRGPFWDFTLFFPPLGKCFRHLHTIKTSRSLISIIFWWARKRKGHSGKRSYFLRFRLTFFLSLTAEPLKSEPWSKYNPLSLTFLCINTQTQDHYGPVGARGNYLERVAVLQVEGGMLITLVYSQDAASSLFFCSVSLWAD